MRARVSERADELGDARDREFGFDGGRARRVLDVDVVFEVVFVGVGRRALRLLLDALRFLLRELRFRPELRDLGSEAHDLVILRLGLSRGFLIHEVLED